MKLNTITAAIAMTGYFQQAEASARTSGNGGTSPQPAKFKFASKEYDLDSGVVSFTFEKGTEREETVEVNVLELPDEMQRQLMLHGMAQKGGDSYAGVKGNAGEAKSNLRDVISQLQAGEWRGAGDEARPRLAELAAAISRIRGVALDKVTVAVEKATDEQRKQWRSNAQVKAMIAKIRAEKAAEQLEAAGEQAPLEINLEQ